ncbi:MAG: VanZ family protein [Nanoarchaeota archaeon]|nr:VanZ family protein [Nanoarchaeota archaeon]
MIKWFEKHNRTSWEIFVLIGLFIFYMSSLSFSGVGDSTLGSYSIIYHIVVFFFFSLFLQISLHKGKEDWFLLIAGIFISLAYGVSDEIHQLFVAGRQCSLLDIVWDGVGIVFSAMIYWISLEFKKQKL